MAATASPEIVDSQIQELDEMLKASQAIRKPNEGQWYVNIAFWLGQQWVRWAGARLVPVELDDGMSEAVDNRIRPIVRTAIAKATKQRPVFTSAPHSLDEDDINGALLSEEVFDYLWDELDMTRKRRSALWWSRLCSAGFLKIYWDSAKGDGVDIYTGSDGKPLFDDTGRPLRPDREDVTQVLDALPPEVKAQLQTKRIAMGEPVIELRNPFQLYPDPLADETGLGSAEWIIEEAIRSVSYVKARYPDHAEYIVADAHASPGAAQSRMPGMGRREGAKNGVLVRELWQKACPEYPSGRRVVWACGRILYSGANPYGWLPYVMFSGDPSGSFWPDAPVTPLISPQTRLNKREAQIDENADRIGNPPLAYPEGMEGMEEWHGLPGEHLEYPSTGAGDAVPSFLQVPELPVYVREDVDRMVSSMREISGQHEVTSGSVPAGVTAASAINLLLEQDDTQLGPDIEDMETALSETGFRVLWLMGNYADDDRMLQIAGEDGDWDIRSFRGDMLRGHYNIKVQAGSGMPRSKAAKQAAMQQLLDLLMRYGGPEALNPRNLRRFLKDMEVGGLERMFADIDVDETKATRENRRLMMGEEVAVNDWDNHAYEIEAHNEARKSSRYERAVAVSPEVATAFADHIAAHQAALAPQIANAIVPPGPGEQPGSPQIVPPGSPSGNGPGAAVPSP